jgi:hypothetical protein
MYTARAMVIGGALALTGMATSIRGVSRAPSHAVVMHIESFTSKAVDVHLKSTPAGLQVVNRSGVPLPLDTLPQAELMVGTPADIRISADVQTFELSTPDNRAVKLTFTDGATDLEKRLHPWGRVLAFKRVDGNLQPSPKVLPVEPAY